MITLEYFPGSAFTRRLLHGQQRPACSLTGSQGTLSFRTQKGHERRAHCEPKLKLVVFFQNLPANRHDASHRHHLQKQLRASWTPILLGTAQNTCGATQLTLARPTRCLSLFLRTKAVVIHGQPHRRHGARTLPCSPQKRSSYQVKPLQKASIADGKTGPPLLSAYEHSEQVEPTSSRPVYLGKNFLNNTTVHVRQPKISPRMTPSKLLVIEPH